MTTPFEIAEDGQPVFSALVKPLRNGGLKVCILVDESRPGDWITLDLDGEKATAAAVRLEQEVARHDRAA